MATWPTVGVEDGLSGKGAKTLAQLLWDRDLAVLQKRTSLPYAEVTTASATFATLVTFSVQVPENLESGDTMIVGTKLRTDDAGEVETASVQIYDTIGASAGTTGTTTSFTYANASSTFTFGVADPGTLMHFALQFKITGGFNALSKVDAVVGNVYFS